MVESKTEEHLYILDHAMPVEGESAEARDLMFGAKWAPSEVPEPRPIPQGEMIRHPRCIEGGGIAMPDNNAVASNAFKRVAKEVAQDLLKGQMPDVMNQSAMAEI